MTLRSRLALAAGAAVAVTVVAVTLSAYAGTRASLRSQVDSSLTNLVGRIMGAGGPGGGGGGGRPPGPGAGGQPSALGFLPPGSALGGPGGPNDGDEGLALDRRGPGFGGPTGLVTLVYADGRVYVPPGQAHKIAVDARMRALAARGRGQYFVDQHISGTHVRVLVEGIGADGALAVALPLTDVDNTLSQELLLLVLIAAAGIAVAAVLGVLVARTALSPIRGFTAEAEEIALNPEQLERQRLQVSGSDELARLGRTFNATLDALEESIRSQRNLVADASHELRTPIASIRANLQLLREESRLSAEDRAALREDMIEELDGLTALVADVVELARGVKSPAAPGDVRVDSVIEEAAARTRRRAPQLSLHLDLEPTLVWGEAERIARAIANLLDNAAKWSSPGDVVEVSLREGIITVRDHGPGFHEEDLPFVFDRFHRARDARAKAGSGLGLAIVRQAAEAHGGFVEASNAKDGGAAMRISFGPSIKPEPEPLGAS